MPVLADGFRLQDANVKNIQKEKWQCEYCKPSNATKNLVTLNVTHKNNDNGHFSTASGDQHRGLGANLDANIATQNAGSSTQLNVKNVGADNTHLQVKTANAHSYQATLEYKTLNSFGHNKALTPYLNPGSSTLSLPDDWQPVAKTSDMPLASFNTFANKVERESWHLNAEKVLFEHWLAYVNFQSETKQGIRTASGNILANVVLLPSPIDQKHNQFELGSLYQFERGSLMVNYNLSDFTNDHDAFIWQSPYSLIFGGALAGQKSTAPDNKQQQISLVGTYRHNNFNLQSQFMYGQLTQQQSFLPYSTNAELTLPTMNVNDLDGEIKTLSARVRASYRINKDWRLKFNYHYDDRDNNTRVYAFQHVLSDSVAFDNTVENRPYSYTKEKMDVQSQWRFNPRSKLNVGWSMDQKDRDYQDREQTENQKYWVKVSTYYDFINNFSLQVSRELRDGSEYQRLDLTSPVISTLRMQKYYLADREREQIKAQLSFTPKDNIDIGIQGYFSRDKYDQTQIGLVKNKRRGIDVSTTIALKENISLSAYVHNQWQDNVSQGSYWFEHVDWRTLQGDKTDTVGLNLTANKLADDRLTLALDFNYSYAQGNAVINKLTQELTEENNELTVNAAHIKLNAAYVYSPKIDLNVEMIFQQFDEQDWRNEYLPDDIINVLGTGVTGFDYDATRLTAGVTYRF